MGGAEAVDQSGGGMGAEGGVEAIDVVRQKGQKKSLSVTDSAGCST